MKVVEETAKKITLAEVVSRGLDTKNNDFEVNLAMANNREKREKEKRSCNIMVFGLNRDEDRKNDEQQTYDLLNVLNVQKENIKRVTRVVPKVSIPGARPPPVIIELSSTDIRNNTLKASRLIKDNVRLGNVSIAQDLTPNERLGLKREKEICEDLNSKLCADCEFTWKVRNGERVKVDKNTNKIFKTTRGKESN